MWAEIYHLTPNPVNPVNPGLQQLFTPGCVPGCVEVARQSAPHFLTSTLPSRAHSPPSARCWEVAAHRARITIFCAVPFAPWVVCRHRPQSVTCPLSPRARLSPRCPQLTLCSRASCFGFTSEPRESLNSATGQGDFLSYFLLRV